jgi:hypothetical protein
VKHIQKFEEFLQESFLGMGRGDKPTTLSTVGDIEQFLSEHKIKSFKINPNTLEVTVNGDVDLRGLKYPKLPLVFDKVLGNFDVDGSDLEDLTGSPRIVGGDFRASVCQLKTIKGCPDKVGKNFYVNANHINSLEGLPDIGGGIYAEYNNLTHLKGLPEEVNGDLFLSSNQIADLKSNPTKIVWGNMELKQNKIISVDNLPTQIKGYLDLSRNYTKDLTIEEVEAISKVGKRIIL